MTRAYDAVIVGGGPAGSAAAYTLASRGHHVCVIDKSQFPRDKLCGGLVTLRSKKLFEQIFERGWDDDLFVMREGVTFYDHTTRIGEIDHYTKLYLTMRLDFDAHLLGHARAAGAQTILGIRIDDIDIAKSQIVLPNGERVAYRYLIGCDGVNSSVARALYGRAFDPDYIAFALECEVPRERVSGDATLPEVYFGAARWGYGWVFPKKKTLTVGIGGFHKYNPDMKGDLERLMKGRGIDATGIKIKGHFLPFGTFRRPAGRGNVLLCGDAAGLVDSISGEGIAYAMQSGHAAAEAVSEALKANAPQDAVAKYTANAAPIVRAIRQSNFARWFVYGKLSGPVFVSSIPNAIHMQKRFLDILAGEKSYDEVPSLLARHFAKGLTDRIFRRGKSSAAA